MSAIKAAFVDCQPVRTRSVWKLVFEIDVADAKAALDVLGIPDPARERWCAIAVLNDSAARSDGTTREESAPSDIQPEAGDAGVAQPANWAANRCEESCDPPKQREGPQVGSEAAARPAQHPLVQMAGILAGDERFQDWLRQCGFILSLPHTDEEYGAACIRAHCDIDSRRELATNSTAAAKFEAMVARFRQETGQMAEARG